MNPNDGGFAQGRSAYCPSTFNGDNFSQWCVMMKMFIIDQDIEV